MRTDLASTKRQFPRVRVIVTGLAGLAALLSGVLFFLNVSELWKSISELQQVQAVVRRGEQAQGEEWNSKWRDYTNQVEQETHAKQDLMLKRFEKYDQQQKEILEQQLEHRRQLAEESLRLSRQTAGLPRNSREYQETTSRMQAVNAQLAQLEQAQQAKDYRDYQILELEEEARSLQMKFMKGLAGRPASQEYQDASNRLNTLRGQFFKLANPAQVEMERDVFGRFRIPGSEPPSSNQVARSTALMATMNELSARSAENRQHDERIKKLNNELFGRRGRMVEAFKSGFVFALAVVAFIVVLAANRNQKPLSSPPRTENEP